MKEKTLKNDCNILLKILADLQKYVYSKKGLKQRSQSPPPPPAPPSRKVEGIFAPKKSLDYRCYL